MLSILVFAGLVIDLGNAYRVQQALQASADAAAAGGAGQLTIAYPPNAGNATTAARHYGSELGGTNPITGVSPADVTENSRSTASSRPATTARTACRTRSRWMRPPRRRRTC